MRTGPLVKRQHPNYLAKSSLYRGPLSSTATPHKKKHTDVGAHDIRVTAAGLDNLPLLANIIDLFVQDTFSLFQLSFPHLQEECFQIGTTYYSTSSRTLARSPQKRSLQKLFQRHLSRDATLLTVQRGSELLAATLLRPLWNIPNALEILAYGINWSASSLGLLLLDTPVAPHTCSDIEFIPSVRQQENLSQYLLSLSISKLRSINSSDPSLFTVVNHRQRQHIHQSHLSLLGCYSVGTLNVCKKRTGTNVYHIFTLPPGNLPTENTVGFKRVSSGHQPLSRHRSSQHKRRVQTISRKKTFIPECIHPSLMNVVEKSQPLMGLHYEVMKGEIMQDAPHNTTDFQRRSPQRGAKKPPPFGIDICQLTKKSNIPYVEALHRSGKELKALIPLSSGETYGIFADHRATAVSSERFFVEKNIIPSTRNSTVLATPYTSGEQEQSVGFFCPDQNEPEMIP